MIVFVLRENRVIPITYDPAKKKLKLHTEWETFPTMNFAKQLLLCEKGYKLFLKNYYTLFLQMCRQVQQGMSGSAIRAKINRWMIRRKMN